MECVERVEKLLLATLALGEELDIVNHQNIDVAISVPELVNRTSLDRLDKMVDERLAGDVKTGKRGLVLTDLMGDGLQQMGLAQPDGSVC